MKKNSLFHKAKRNAVSSYINFGVNSVLTFAFTPYLMQYLGKSDFGIWKSIQKFLTFASVADGRSTQALKWIIANDEGNDDTVRKQQAVGSAVKIWLYFLPLVIVITGIIIWKMPDAIKNLEPAMRPVVQMAGFILGANLLLNPLFGIPDSILVGANLGYKSNRIKTQGVVITNVLMVVAAYLGYGITGLAMVVLFSTLVNGFFVYLMCKRDIAWLGIRKPTPEQVKQFFGFSFWVLIWSFIARFILATEIILIGYLAGADEVANYTTTAYMSQLAVSIALITGTAVTPGLGKLIGSNDLEKGRRVVNDTREVIRFIAAFFAGTMLVLNKNFVILWMGEAQYMGDYNNLLITFVMIQMVMFRNEGQIQDLSLDIRRKVLIGGLLSLASVGLGIAFFHLLGGKLEGLFLGILTGRFFLNLIYRKMVDRMMKMKSDFRSFAMVLVLAAACFFAGQQLPVSHSWIVFLIVSGCTGAVLVSVCYYLFLSSENKKKILGLIKKFG